MSNAPRKNRRHDRKIAEHRALMAAARKSERQANLDAIESMKADNEFYRAQRRVHTNTRAQDIALSMELFA